MVAATGLLKVEEAKTHESEEDSFDSDTVEGKSDVNSDLDTYESAEESTFGKSSKNLYASSPKPAARGTEGQIAKNMS